MFDVGWSELLVIGVVALLVVGPKELPVLLRTVGRYVGMMRRQATEFRAQFDEAMRDSELEKLKEEMQKTTSEATSAIRDAESSLDRDLERARDDMNASLKADAEAKAKSEAESKGTAAIESSLPDLGQPAVAPPAELSPKADVASAPSQPADASTASPTVQPSTPSTSNTAAPASAKTNGAHA